MQGPLQRKLPTSPAFGYLLHSSGDGDDLLDALAETVQVVIPVQHGADAEVFHRGVLRGKRKPPTEGGK